jgi:hypothetical protein
VLPFCDAFYGHLMLRHGARLTTAPACYQQHLIASLEGGAESQNLSLNHSLMTWQGFLWRKRVQRLHHHRILGMDHV